MAPEGVDKISSHVLGQLEGTKFASESLLPLSGGTANFIYRAALKSPLVDGTTDVLVKHGEGYVAQHPGFALTTARCAIEEECLKALSSFAVAATPDTAHAFPFVVKTPRCFHFDAVHNTQVQEYLPKGVDLKNYALKNCASPTPELERPQYHQLGRALGRYLREFHDWTSQHADLRRVLAKNKEMQAMKHMINFDWLLASMKRYPDILGGDEVSRVFNEVKAMGAKELEDETQLQVIHGDFWTGNILLPNEPLQEGVETPVFVIDWELAQLGRRNLDLGQMVAELYELWLYKKIDAGLWMVQGFVEGYGEVSREFVFRTAIQTGSHLVNFGTSVAGWGTPEQQKQVCTVGRDVIMNAWESNEAWFLAGDLSCLFSQVK